MLRRRAPASSFDVRPGPLIRSPGSAVASPCPDERRYLGSRTLLEGADDLGSTVLCPGIGLVLGSTGS